MPYLAQLISVSNLHGFGIRQYGHFWPLWRTLYGRFDQLSIYWQRNNVSLLWPWPVINVKTIFACQQKIMVHAVSSTGNKQVMASVFFASFRYRNFRRPPLIAVGFREFGAEQKDLGRVIDPYQNNDERARSAVAGRHVTASNVKADQMLADRK